VNLLRLRGSRYWYRSRGRRANTVFLGAERDCSGRAGRARAGCAFARSCPAAAHGSADTVMVAADGWGNGHTLAAGARSAQRDTRRSKAEFRIVDRQRFEVAWPLARLAGKRANRENQGTGTGSTMLRGSASFPISPGR